MLVVGYYVLEQQFLLKCIHYSQLDGVYDFNRWNLNGEIGAPVGTNRAGLVDGWRQANPRKRAIPFNR